MGKSVITFIKELQATNDPGIEFPLIICYSKGFLEIPFLLIVWNPKFENKQ